MDIGRTLTGQIVTGNKTTGQNMEPASCPLPSQSQTFTELDTKKKI